jgi:hypothetical protein
MRENAQSEVFEYGNGILLGYVGRSFGRFGGVLISSNHQTASSYSRIIIRIRYMVGQATKKDDSRTTKSTFSASECRSNLRDS